MKALSVLIVVLVLFSCDIVPVTSKKRVERRKDLNKLEKIVKACTEKRDLELGFRLIAIPGSFWEITKSHWKVTFLDTEKLSENETDCVRSNIKDIRMAPLRKIGRGEHFKVEI